MNPKQMSGQDLFYSESGKVNPVYHVFSYLIYLFLALLLGIIYTYATILSPTIYLNLVVTIGFSIAMGLSILIVIRLFHNRNKKSQVTQAIIFIFLAYYFHWTAFIFFAQNGFPPSFGEYLANLSWIFSPADFFTAIAQINSGGTWKIIGFRLTGVILIIVWIIEAAILFAGPIAAVIRNKVYPYSENLSKWYPKYTLNRDFESVVATENFIQDLKTDTLNTIRKLDKGTAIRHTKIHVFYLREEDTQYLTFEKIVIEGQGKGAKSKDIVINNFKTDRITAEKILEEFANRRERTKVF